jgi:outer membrane lipoprotein-sorting protein
MKGAFSLLLFFVTVFSCRAEDSVFFENRLKNMFDSLYSFSNDFEKVKYNTVIIDEFKSFLASENSFENQLDSITTIGKIVSDDERVKVYTWNIPLKNGSHKFYGFIHYYHKDEKTYKYYELTETNDKSLYNEKSRLSPSKWYGALYYKIIHVSYRGEDQYILLGFDPNDVFSNKKLIDVLTFDEYGYAFLGKPVFKYPNEQKSRIIFEYSSRAQMALNYNEKEELIIFDHLAPSRPSYRGKYQFYGPDFSYDALEFDKGFWYYKKDVDVRNASL